MSAPEAKYTAGDRVCIRGRDDTAYTVSAGYHVERWHYYELAGLPDFLVKDSRLRPANDDKETTPCSVSRLKS